MKKAMVANSCLFSFILFFLFWSFWYSSLKSTINIKMVVFFNVEGFNG